MFDKVLFWRLLELFLRGDESAARRVKHLLEHHLSIAAKGGELHAVGMKRRQNVSGKDDVASRIE